MKHIKIITPKFYEYPYIVLRFIFVSYILARNGLLTEIEKLNLINKKYQKIFNILKFILQKKKIDFKFVNNLV